MTVCTSTPESAPNVGGSYGETMTEYDYNGHRIHPGHDGEPRGHPTGPYRPSYVWLLRRNDDKLYGYWESRHGAVGALATEQRITRTQRPAWFEPVRVPAASTRATDVIELNNPDYTEL